MDIVGGLIITVVILAAAACVGLWARMNPATDHAVPDETGISEAEWSEAIR